MMSTRRLYNTQCKDLQNSGNEERGIITFCLKLCEVLDAFEASATTDMNPVVSPVPNDGVWMDKVETAGLQEEVGPS